jgi:hypothetical protein
MIHRSDGGGTYSTKQGFQVELPPSATLVRIANKVSMGFELEQVICDTFDPYVLIDPSPIICVCLILIVSALVSVCQLGHIMLLGLFLAYLGFICPHPMTIRDSCLVAVYT